MQAFLRQILTGVYFNRLKSEWLSTPPPGIRWQAPMTHVLVGLVPIGLAALYFFGWRVLLLLVVANAVGFATELLFVRAWKQPVTSAVFVSCTLFVFSLPPLLPLWMVALGSGFAIAFGKMAFGGFGRNVFNPALVGRAFLYISFGGPMTARWSEPFRGGLGGFAHYAPDAITGATPGMLLKTGAEFSLWDLFIGSSAGTIGGTSAVLAILGGLYIVWRKAANFRIVVAGIGGYLLTQFILWQAGVPKAVEPLHAVLAGSFLIGIFFYATEPVSASRLDSGRWIYGAFIGVMSSLISVYSVWPAGTMFAILLANMMAPIMDYGLKQLRAGKVAP
jgi:Na+-transporting NADH:ubiquinone oxidoreductase subunit B